MRAKATGKHLVTLEIDIERDSYGCAWGSNFTAPKLSTSAVLDYAQSFGAEPGAQWDRPPYTRVVSVDPVHETEGNERRAAFGKQAVNVGTPDRGQNDDRTDATDTIANVLHFLRIQGEDDPSAVLNSAAAHFYAETEGEEADEDLSSGGQRGGGRRG